MTDIVFHIDVNSAYLSWSAVEKLKNGSDIDLRTIPSIIGGDEQSRRGVVLAKSVPAKVYGVVTGEPVAMALRKCPSLTLEPPNQRLYGRYSHRLMELLHTYTSDIEQLSVDECFLNFGPIAHRYSSALEAADTIKNTVKGQLGFTVNIGIAPNKLLAKMASDFQKPDRVHTLFTEEIPIKMWPLPVRELYSVGKSSAARLDQLGIRTIGELATTDVSFLVSHFKSHGRQIWEYANGIDHSHVDASRRDAKGIGNSTTLKEDVLTDDDAKKVLLSLSESVSSRLRSSGQLAGSISVEIKYSTFETSSHQMTFSRHTNTTQTIYICACQLFDELWKKEPIRLLGIRTAKLVAEDTPVQMSIFDLESSYSKEEETTIHQTDETLQNLDNALDTIRKKYGSDAIIRGSSLKKN